jgi:hypothetical protein
VIFKNLRKYASQGPLLAGAASPVQTQLPGGSAAFGLAVACIRILLGDHTFLLVYLAVAWPLGTITNVAVQYIS